MPPALRPRSHRPSIKRPLRQLYLRMSIRLPLGSLSPSLLPSFPPTTSTPTEARSRFSTTPCPSPPPSFRATALISRPRHQAMALPPPPRLTARQQNPPRLTPSPHRK